MKPTSSNKGLGRAAWFLGLILISALSVEAQTAIRWITASGGNAEFQEVLFQYLDAEKQARVLNENVDAQRLRTLLESANDDAPLVVQCNLETYEQLLRQPDARDLLSRLHLKLSNPQLFSISFYILSFVPDPEKIKGDPLQVAFITLPVPEFQSIQEADLLNVFSEILGRPKNSIRILRERDAYTAAKNLYSGSYHMVGIYEDDPSTLLNEFEVNLTQELRAKSPVMLSLRSEDKSQLREVAPGRLAYVLFTIEDPLRAGERLTLLGLAPAMKFPFPVILSHVPEPVETSLSTALSYAYFLALPTASSIASDQERHRMERMYLYNAFLQEPDNRLKGLAFLSYLMLMEDRSGSDSFQRELFADKVKLFLKTLHLEKINSRTILAWLGIQIPKLDKRQLFTDDVSKIYQDAIAKIDEASNAKGASRVELLEAARKDLIAAILHDARPRDIKGSRGLWSATNYNPYYQLARVTFYLQAEGKQ